MLRFLSSLGYIGYIPILPGTFGTAGGVIIGILMKKAGNTFYFTGLIFLILITWALSHLVIKTTGEIDPPWFVMDEVVGFLISIVFIKVTVSGIVAAFIIFRIMDILKFFPINLINDKMRNGMGMILDDMLAGTYTAVLLYLLNPLFRVF